jgi:hypothetical protein
LNIFDVLSDDQIFQPQKNTEESDGQLTLLDNPPQKSSEFSDISSFIRFRDSILDFQKKSGELDCYSLFRAILEIS